MKTNQGKTVESKTPYLIAVRLRGGLRSSIQFYMNAIKSNFGKGKIFPHITLFGPFSTRMGRQQIVDKIIIQCETYPEARFSTDGFSFFDIPPLEPSGKQGKGIVFAEVKPNESLKQLRYYIARSLLPSSQATPYDHKKNNFKFHITLASGPAGNKFKKTNKDLKSSKLEYDDVTPELVLYYRKEPVFSYLAGWGPTIVQPKNLFAEPP